MIKIQEFLLITDYLFFRKDYNSKIVWSKNRFSPKASVPNFKIDKRRNTYQKWLWLVWYGEFGTIDRNDFKVDDPRKGYGKAQWPNEQNSTPTEGGTALFWEWVVDCVETGEWILEHISQTGFHWGFL